MRRRLPAVVLAALVVAVIGVAVVRPETFWRLDGPSLEASVEDDLGYEVENCERSSDQRWGCDYAFDALSGIAGHVRVQQRGGRCWSASTELGEGHRSAKGCISAWQFFKAM